MCNKLAGSALLQNESLVEEILQTVVARVDVPVTLKIRTGSSCDARNGLTIAKIAEQSGIQALAVHGRTRACKFKGDAEFDTIAQIKQQLSIPVIANGDITSPQKAKFVLEYTGADAIMIGRGAQGNPWLFNAINHYLDHGTELTAPSRHEVHEVLQGHVQNLHTFYGEYSGTRIARKHIGWYLEQHHPNSAFRKSIMKVDSAQQQLEMLEAFFTNDDNQTTIAA